MHTERFTIFIVIAAASAWGLFWLPLRAFEEHGLSAGWTTLAVFATPALALLPTNKTLLQLSEKLQASQPKVSELAFSSSQDFAPEEVAE